MTQPEIRAVVFDYGGVLTGPVHHSISAWLAADRIDPESFSRTIKAWLSRDVQEGTPIHQLELGQLTVAEFDRLFAAELKTHDGTPVSPEGVLARMFANMRADDEMFDLVTDLRDADVLVGLLSNSWGNTYPRQRLDALFHSVVISGEVGLRKPSAAIYELAVKQLGVAAEGVVFIDDAEPNLIGAKAVGMHGILHRSPAETRAALEDLIPKLKSRGATS